MNTRSPITRQDFINANTIVVKVGTSVVTTSNGSIAIGRLGMIVEQICNLVSDGKRILLVTSGAVGIGKTRLRKSLNVSTSDDRSLEYSFKMCAALGQPELMAIYEMLFGSSNISCAQVLVTEHDFENTQAQTNITQILLDIMDSRIVPIVNENDTVSQRSQPIKDVDDRIFWDNDSLAALIGHSIKADLIVLLSDVEGLYRSMPVDNTEPEIIRVYSTHHRCAISTDGTYLPMTAISIGSGSLEGRGGMTTKIEAAIKAVNDGVPVVVIASGKRPNVLYEILTGQLVGTIFTSDWYEMSSNIQKTESESQQVSTADLTGKLDDPLFVIIPTTTPNLDRGKIISSCSTTRQASRFLLTLPLTFRRQLLLTMADHLMNNITDILQVNQHDCSLAICHDTSIDRLKLTTCKIQTLVTGLRQIANSVDPINRLIRQTFISHSLQLEQRTVPLGVLLVIFESRPDVLPQIVALSLFSGNGLILKGGSEARETNRFIFDIVRYVIRTVSMNYELDSYQVDLLSNLVQLFETRDEVEELLKCDTLIDLVIPRGSKEMVDYVRHRTRIPVLGHTAGICHVYIDSDARIDTAWKVVQDAKTDYPTACNAMETLLIAQPWLDQNFTFLNRLENIGVTLRYSPSTIARYPTLKSTSSQSDFSVEYGDLTCTVHVVDDVSDAIAHINTYSSAHTDSIITENLKTADRFLREIDSACVFHNASTRFADGYRFGLGAEVGISTDRIHARGPVGLEGLCSTKWLLRSTGVTGDAVSEYGRVKSYSFESSTTPP